MNQFLSNISDFEFNYQTQFDYNNIHKQNLTAETQ